MTLLDVLTAPWAIEPAKLHEIQAIYATHLRGEKIDLSAVEARLGRPLANEPQPYTITDGVAVLHVGGVMAKRMNLFSQISGGISTQIAARDLLQAGSDPAVHSIIQVFDTPGGTVDGTQAFANIIREVGAIKPVVTLADGMMASAGVWAGTAASQIYIAENTTSIGSIGVVTQHVDLSAKDALSGIKRTEIFAGKYKRIASDTGPLTDAGRQSMQDTVDYIYSLFVQAVATQRRVSVDTVLQDMADGRMFTGEQAIAAGLADGIATLDELIVQLNQDRTKTTSQSRASTQTPKRTSATNPVHPASTQKGTTAMTPEEFTAENPEGAATLRAAGASAERARIQSIEAQAITGHEALISALKFDGKSTAGDAAMAMLAAEKQTRQAQATALASDAPQPLPLAPVSAIAPVKAEKTEAEKAAHAEAYAAEKGIGIVAALKALGYAAT